MTRVGLRELHLQTAKCIERVRAGETIEVTDRGRPVAMLTPIPERESTYERLVRKGRLIPSEDDGSVLDLEPLEPTPGVPTVSELLEQANADER